MNVVLLLAHEIAEYDDLRMFTDLGYDVFVPGGYEDPVNHTGLRPGVPNARAHPDLSAACHAVRAARGDPGDMIDWAKAELPDEVLAWADVAICHHFLDRWIVPQWARLKAAGVRVIWRTCGQSDPRLETLMRPLHDDGLTIVRYSPKEREYFSRLGCFAGEDAMIRFGKYLDEFPLWIGDGGYIANVTQNMSGRGDFCGLDFWLQATAGLDARPAGPGSEALPGGVGTLTYPEMLDYLAHAGVYLYTGTVPASYTLGLIEAMAVGVPIVGMPASAWRPFGCEGLAEWPNWTYSGSIFPQGIDTREAHKALATALAGRACWPTGVLLPDAISDDTRNLARVLFDVRTVGPQWKAVLG